MSQDESPRDIDDIITEMRKDITEAEVLVKCLENDSTLKKYYKDRYSQFCIEYVIELIQEYVDGGDECKEIVLVGFGLLDGFDYNQGIKKRFKSYVNFAIKAGSNSKIRAWADAYSSFKYVLNRLIVKLIKNLKANAPKDEDGKRHLNFAENVKRKLNQKYPDGIPLEISLPLPRDPEKTISIEKTIPSEGNSNNYDNWDSNDEINNNEGGGLPINNDDSDPIDLLKYIKNVIFKIKSKKLLSKKSKIILISTFLIIILVIIIKPKRHYLGLSYIKYNTIAYINTLPVVDAAIAYTDVSSIKGDLIAYTDMPSTKNNVITYINTPLIEDIDINLDPIIIKSGEPKELIVKPKPENASIYDIHCIPDDPGIVYIKRQENGELYILPNRANAGENKETKIQVQGGISDKKWITIIVQWEYTGSSLEGGNKN